MNLQNIGHSCFLIKTSQGRRILLDPFDESIGYSPFKESVDIITISHCHFDHNCTKYYDNCSPIIINSAIKYDSGYAKIEGFNSYHDKLKGLKRGPNVIFRLEVDGIKMCHLGDLGHILDSNLIEKIGKIDILFVPVGGNYTLNATESAYLCNLIKSTYVIPMHYMTHRLSYRLNDALKFIISMKNVINIKDNNVSSDNLDFSITSYNNILLFNN